MATETTAQFKNILCQKCGKRMLIEVDDVPREHRCPVCQAVFIASLQAGELNVDFPELL